MEEASGIWACPSCVSRESCQKKEECHNASRPSSLLRFGMRWLPADADLPTDGENPFTPVKLRLVPQNTYQDSIDLRVDDITVVKLKSD